MPAKFYLACAIAFTAWNVLIIMIIMYLIDDKRT